MKLYGSDVTPYGRKVRIVLAELGLDYARDTAPAASRTPEAMAGFSPALRVPCLEDGERVLVESNLIIEYLLATYGDRAGSGDTAEDTAGAPPLARAMTRPEQHWEDRTLQGVLDALLEASVNIRQLGLSGIAPEQSTYLQRHQQRIGSILDWLEPRAEPILVPPGGLLPGCFSVQDLSLVAALDFGERFAVFAWRGRPRLEALHARLSERPSVAGTAPPA